MICNKCGTENEEVAVFCGSCGARLDGKIKCPTCGKYIDPSTVFCPECGARTDGKKPCPKCGALVKNEQFCPTCGFSLKKPQPVAFVPTKKTDECEEKIVQGDEKKNIMKSLGGWMMFAALIGAVVYLLLLLVFVFGKDELQYVISEGELRWVIIKVVSMTIAIAFSVLAVIWFFKSRRSADDKLFFLFFSLAFAFFTVYDQLGTTLYYLDGFKYFLYIINSFQFNLVKLLMFAGSLLYVLATAKEKCDVKRCFFGWLGVCFVFETYWMLPYGREWLYLFLVLNLLATVFAVFAMLMQSRGKIKRLGILASAIGLGLNIASLIFCYVSRYEDGRVICWTDFLLWIPAIVCAIIGTSATVKTSSGEGTTEPYIIKEKIGLSVFLSIITCGIYGIVWMASLVRNIHRIQNKSGSIAKEMLCLIFVPIYPIIWWYTRGESVKESFGEYGLPAKGNGTVYLILAIFGLSIVSQGIMQSDFNSFEEKISSYSQSLPQEVGQSNSAE